MRKNLVFAALIIFVISAVGFLIMHSAKAFAQSGATYVGADKCKGCHAKQYADYEARKFTKAWSVLQMRGKTKDPECLKCHVTGYEKPGGFVSEESTPNMKFKQCESCHGPGSLHVGNPSDGTAMMSMRSYVTEKNVCIDCHKCMKTHREADF